MNPRTISRIRTNLPTAWASLVLYAADRWNWTDVHTDAVIYVAVPLAGAILYDLGRTLETRGWRRTAATLLGVARTPVYLDAPTRTDDTERP